MADDGKVAAMRRALAVIKLKKGDGEPVRVCEGVFMGSIGAAHNASGLKSAGITHVLSMSTSSGAKFPEEFTYKSVVIDDKPGRRIVSHFKDCFEFIEEGKAAGGVLVHCFQGKSRCASVILGYQMYTTKRPFLELLDQMRIVRPAAQPNPGFAAQLLAFQRNNLDLEWAAGTSGDRASACAGKCVGIELAQGLAKEKVDEGQVANETKKTKKKKKKKKSAQGEAQSAEPARITSPCAGCGAEKEKADYSKRQWSLKATERQCKQCVAASNPSDPSARVELVVQQLSIDDYLKPTGRTEKWWAAYQAAFLREHEWMESKAQSTSRGMGLGAARMAPLVFKDEAGSKLKRVCFFASYGVGSDACGYATVDIDQNPAAVCHVRMVLVAPECQRQGVGLKVLMAVTTHLHKRHLGLKFARCHDYERFYSKAGFIQIGKDDLYVYMALKRK
jgi:GNAT superfamily N-acetyltransferase